MLGCPLPNESLGRSGCEVALSHSAVKIKYKSLHLPKLYSLIYHYVVENVGGRGGRDIGRTDAETRSRAVGVILQ